MISLALHHLLFQPSAGAVDRRSRTRIRCFGWWPIKFAHAAEAAAEPPCGTSYNIICTAERNAAKELPGGWRPTLAQSAVRASCFPSALARLRPQALSCQSRAGRSVAFNATPRTREVRRSSKALLNDF